MRREESRSLKNGNVRLEGIGRQREDARERNKGGWGKKWNGERRMKNGEEQGEKPVADGEEGGVERGRGEEGQDERA